MPLGLLQNGQLSIATVVFATDFSAVSAGAGLYAAAIAAHFHAELVVVHGYIPSHAANVAEMMAQHPSADRLERIAHLNSAAATFTTRGLHVRTQLLDGDPSETIARFADSLSNAMLVLGTHGGSALGRHLIGSVAERSLRRAACPTLTVGPHVASPDPSNPFRSMVYATDCSTMASRAAPLACAIAGSFHCELKVISIVDEQDGPAPELLADLNFRTQQEMDHQLPGTCDHFSGPRAVTSPGSARDAILRYASDARSDLLILGVHRRANIELLDRNSVTIQLIVKASCPVLTVTRDATPGVSA